MTTEVYKSNTAISMADFELTKADLGVVNAIHSISFSKFVDIDKKTAKSYDVVDGQLDKSTCGSFWNGSYDTITLPYNQLPNFIESMTAGEFIVQGIHQTINSGNCPADATRAKDLFPFSDSEGLMCIDTDSINKFMGIINLDDVIAAFNRIESALEPVFKFCSTSASSFVEYNGINSGLKGLHTFMPIDKASAIPRVLECLHVRAVNAGYVYPLITKDGKILIRSLVDMALKTSNQPIFEGGAIMKNPAITQDRAFKLYEGGLLQSSDIKPLSNSERSKFAATVKLLTDSMVDEAALIKQRYIQDKAEEIKQNTPDIKDKHVRYLITEAINGVLYGHHSIVLDSRKEVTVQTILENPADYHGKGCADPLDNNIFGKSIIYTDKDQAVIHSFAKGGGTFKLKGSLQEWEIDLNLHVDVFNKDHTQILIGGKHKIMRTVPASVHYDNRVSYEFFSIDQLRLMYANQLITVGNKKAKVGVGDPILKDAVTAWSTNRHSICYTGGVVFAPAKKLPPEYYNTWQGFSVEPIAGADTGLLNYHIEKVICAEDKEHIEYLYNWIAYTMQHPDKPAGAAPVLCGDKGVGKGIFGNFLCKLWGEHGIHMSQTRHLVGNFNGHLADICFIFADEAFFSGDKKSEGVLKALITEPTIVIERKGLQSVQQPNFLKILMATNNEHAVPASKDERRYFVLNVSNAQVGNTQYFRSLSTACADEAVRSAFLYEMLHSDIRHFSPSAIPESKGLKEQRLHSLNSIGKWLVDAFAEGTFGFSVDNHTLSWQKEISSKDLHESYVRWVNTNKVCSYDIVTQHSLGRYLSRIYKPKKIKGDMRGYSLGSLNDAIRRFEQYEKVDLGLIEATPFNDWLSDQYDGSVPILAAMSANNASMGSSSSLS